MLLNDLESISEEPSLLPSMFTHKEFDLTTGASSAEESTDIVQTYIGIIQQGWNITLI